MSLPRGWCTRSFPLALVLIALATAEAAASEGRTVFRVALADPIAPQAARRQYEVAATRDKDGSPAGFHLTFDMRVCPEGLCRIVRVTIYWDALGHYQRLECPADAPLTRMEHEPFTSDDYRKLDRILKDRQSVLGRLAAKALVEQQPEQEQQRDPTEVIDGWSGATPQTVRDSVVEGAVYTTWTLWHWANGEIVPHLRAWTAQRATPELLRRLLRSELDREVEFALRHVQAHHASDEQFADDAFQAMEDAGRLEHVELALNFVSRAVRDEQRLHERLIDSLGRMDAHTSRPLLSYFASQPDLPAETLEGLSGALERLPYFQVHRILLLLEQRECSQKVEADVARLLDHENFFIARRAYEHLLKGAPGAATLPKLDAFREKYRGRL